MPSLREYDIPKLAATERLRAFRAEAGISWPEFNILWMLICHFINAPSNDILLDSSRAEESKYYEARMELTSDVLATGLFGPGTRGRWQSNIDPHRLRIYVYIGEVAAYAAEEVVKQLPVGGQPLLIEADKVGGWLMNQHATSWENYAFFPRPPLSDFAPTEVNSSHTSLRSMSTIVPEISSDAVNYMVNSDQHVGEQLFH